MIEFTRVRDRRQFHNLMSLLLANIDEVAGLSQVLQWVPVQSAIELAQQDPPNHGLDE